MNYQLLEGDFTTQTGISQTPGITFDQIPTFIYTLLFGCIIAAVVVRLFIAGVLRIGSSQSSIKKSSDVIHHAVWGVFLVIFMILFVALVNRDLLRSSIDLSGFRANGVSSAVQTGGSQAGQQPSTTQAPSNSASCTSPESVISAMSTNGGICAGTPCTVLAGCNYAQYLPIIKTESSRQGVDPKMVVAIMCRESRANPNPRQHINTNGTYDCGLMQINQQGGCSPSILDPATNIAAGVALIKQKINANNQLYQNIPKEAGVFASYNCCGNDTNPNSESVDCTPSKDSRFPFTLPKWACPINPGPTATNMCFVKGYVCELTACLSDPALSGL